MQPYCCRLLPFVLVVTFLHAAAQVRVPAIESGTFPSTAGIYVVNEAANEQSTATAYATGMLSSPGYQNSVTGHAIFVPIAKILPSITTWGEFNWDWTYVDTLVQVALSNGKRFSIELEVGFQASNTYLQSLPSGFAAACGSNCAPLFDVWVVGGSAGQCVSAYVLLPWVTNVQNFWTAAATALAAHLKQTGAYSSLTLVHVPGASVYDEEIRLPTGLPGPASTDTSMCPDGRPAYPTVANDAATTRWQGLGYSDAAVVSGFKTIATAYAQAFPDRVLGLSLFNPGANGVDFPNLTNDTPGYVASQIVEAVNAVAPGRVQIQSDNLDSDFAQTEVIKDAAQYADAIGWQTNKHAQKGAGCNGGGASSCDPDGDTGPFFQLLQNGIANHGAYLEVWSNDVVRYPLGIAAALPLLCQTFSSACVLNLSNTTLNFGTVLVPGASAAQTVSLNNVGSVPLTISGLSASGDFAETNTCGSVLGLGASCAASIIFKPTGSGTRNGQLSVSDDASSSPQSVSLTGVGTNSVVLQRPSRSTRPH